jgi:hypothetical protein
LAGVFPSKKIIFAVNQNNRKEFQNHNSKGEASEHQKISNSGKRNAEQMGDEESAATRIKTPKKSGNQGGNESGNLKRR